MPDLVQDVCQLVLVEQLRLHVRAQLEPFVGEAVDLAAVVLMDRRLLGFALELEVIEQLLQVPDVVQRLLNVLLRHGAVLVCEG